MTTWLKNKGLFGNVFALYLSTADSPPLSKQLNNQGMEKSAASMVESVLDSGSIKCFLFAIDMAMTQRFRTTC
jgi:hypothetical protein